MLVSGSEWLRGHGVDVIGNGGDSSTYYQCVELPQLRLYPSLGWPRVHAAGNGGAAYLPEGSPGLERHDPGSGYVPVPGDLVIENPSDRNPYGHVAVVDSVEGDVVHAVEQNASPTGRHDYLVVDGDYVGAYTSVKTILHAPQNTFTTVAMPDLPEGSLVTTGGDLYRVVGGAPLYLPSLRSVGGSARQVTPLSQAQLDSMRRYPADGTLVRSLPSGQVSRFAGGAPLRVVDWATIGGRQPMVTVDDLTLARAGTAAPFDRVRAVPEEGAFVRDGRSQSLYRVVGGAAVPVSSWAAVGGEHPVTVIDPWELTHHQHLRAAPSDTFVRGLPSGRVYAVAAGGRPFAVADWSQVGGPHPTVEVEDAAVAGCTPFVCAPAGAVSSVTAHGGDVTVTGWSVDPDVPTQALRILVSFGGPAGSPTSVVSDLGLTARNTPAVGSRLPGTGAHQGFELSLPHFATTVTGIQDVWVYAVNAPGTGGTSTSLVGRGRIPVTTTR